MIVKVRDFVKENNMISKNDKVLVALSGGPDSICLIHILNELKDELGIEILAAHLNHCLRGEDANKDEEYVREFCKSLNIQCYVKRVDINRYAKERALSSEMAGREARYEFFNDLKEEFNINKIAVAHNLNDQAETVLMRLMRGTGIEGLIGIRPVRDNIYIRPILSLNRHEIEAYCEDNKLLPRIDKTNLETIYSRNKVRLELIPYIEKNFNEDIINTLNRF
ncbi:tRNA lysidine(34) synthetase TilS, partial [Clostridium sp.]|uniref:tRNA lysidine(34) synthetase TilS n=1 Tax=Clostridium sp. TaxID=1506 RepID=UPI003464AC39